MMRLAAIGVSLLLATGAAPAGQASSAPAPTVQAPAVQAPPVQAWVDAFNSRDPKRIVALYAPDAALWGTTAKTLARTPEEIRAYFKDADQRPHTRVTIEQQHQRVVGDLVIASGAYTFAEVNGGVRSNVRPARFTFVFRRAGDTWQIVEHHSSRLPEP